MDCDCIKTWRLIATIQARREAGHFQNNLLDKWSTATLNRIVMALEWSKRLKTSPDLPAEDVNEAGWLTNDDTDELLTDIWHNLSARGAFREKVKAEREIWVNHFTSQLMDDINLEAISHLPEIRAAFPACVSHVAGLPVVCWKYNTPAGLEICNEKATMLKAHKFATRACDCARINEKFKDHSGHVCTTKLDIIEDPTLRNLMKKGTTFRKEFTATGSNPTSGSRNPKPMEIIMLTESLKHYIENSSEMHEIPTIWFQEWKNLVIKAAGIKIEALRNEIRLSQEDEEAIRRSQNYLLEFRSKYAIITADKAKNTYVITCKPWLCQQAMKEAVESKSYEASQENEEDVIGKDLEFVVKENIARYPNSEDPPPDHALVNEALPTFGVVTKLHKNNAQRFLAKSHGTSLTQLSEWISRSLKAMMPNSEQIWRSLFQSVGIRTHGSWIITNSKQVRSVMTRMTAQKLHSDTHQTYDFSTMFPSLNLECLKMKMRDYVELVFEHACQFEYPRKEPKALELKRRGLNSRPWRAARKCQSKDTLSQKVVTKDRLINWMNYLFDNLHTKVGDLLLRQTVGVPMGTSCAPWVANLFLFMYEFEYMSALISDLKPWEIEKQEGKWQFIRNLSFCTRYIDDLWNPLVDKTEFEKITVEMYPAESGLKLGDPEHDGPLVDYLDMSIWFDRESKQWHSKLFDKKIALVAKGLKLNKFPDPSSKLATRCKYGVITSQLHRYWNACTTLKDFLTPAQQLYELYHRKGYSKTKINQYFKTFLRRHIPECNISGTLKRWNPTSLSSCLVPYWH